ncbi:UvrD-helicase domain-containing protein [Idiomarina sp. UBA4520]|nr:MULTISPECIES: ATP-dependent helicase [unclassified Idiomarina]|tara:strand:+ start:57053 stop:58813 length:1761 start_codon:yes stop_codon:yes gene_type:complete
MIEFTEEQNDYLYSNVNEHVFLEACPGSGKTEVVARKFAREVSNWKKSPGGIAILSFTNSATDELVTRISKYLPTAGKLFPHTVGTFDSFILKNVVNPLARNLTNFTGKDGDFSIRIVDKSSNLHGYKTKYGIAGVGPVSAHQFSLGGEDLSFSFDTGESGRDRKLNSHSLEDWQQKDLLQAKSRMWSSGFATYADIEYLAIEALTKQAYREFLRKLARRFPLIIIDECQDLSFDHLLILRCLSEEGVKLHFIGDLHQAIYSFRDVDPEKVKQFVKEKNFIPLKLTRNFRSCQNIINLCGKLTGRTEIVGQASSLSPSCHLLQYEKCPTELIEEFSKYSERFDNVVLLGRGYSLLSKFDSSLSSLKPIHRLALAIRKIQKRDNNYIKESLVLFSDFLRINVGETVKPNSYSCPEKVNSNLRWRKFLFSSLKYIAKQNIDMNLTWSEWAKSIGATLRNISSQPFVCEELKPIVSPLDSIKLRAPSGQSKASVESTLGEAKTLGTIRKKTTIHQAKGQTHDVTILVSSSDGRGSKGAYWKDWLNDQRSEEARFAYVASSRPKYILVWAVKRLNKKERKVLSDIGFHIH